ncbi:MAG: hypothetical protein BM558_12170 [Roseobacter sp. MedPE-SW]|nr:MAG: hypothetical protein BM558_12170 [Roseobacter sp. MedPE-SW]
MYDENHLIAQLHAASEGHETRNFATFPARASVTFGELFAGAERNAAALVAMGVKPGDRVAV